MTKNEWKTKLADAEIWENGNEYEKKGYLTKLEDLFKGNYTGIAKHLVIGNALEGRKCYSLALMEYDKAMDKATTIKEQAKIERRKRKALGRQGATYQTIDDTVANKNPYNKL